MSCDHVSTLSSRCILSCFPLFLICLVSLVAVPVPSLNASVGAWIHKGPSTTNIHALAIDTNASQTIYVGTSEDGIFKSTDGGGRWIQCGIVEDIFSLYDGGLIPDVREIVIDPASSQTIYAAAGGRGILKSTDGGSNWVLRYLSWDIRTIALDAAHPQTIYAGQYDTGISKSTDGGGTWRAMNNGLTDTRILSLAIDPALPQTVYASTEIAGMFKSTDGGTQWASFDMGFSGTFTNLS
jgi:photosystem II stability/assembly factor-like uncharacterized protein